MKKLILLLCVCFFVSISSNAQWTVVNMGTNYNFTYVILPTPQLFYATAYNPTTYAGVLYKSTNGGINWSQLALPSTISYPYSCDFSPDGTQGIITGVGPIIYTSNSGVNWQALWTPSPSDTIIIFGESETGETVETFWFVGNKINYSHDIIAPVVIRCANLAIPNPIFNVISLPGSMSSYQLTSVSTIDSTTCYIGVNSSTFTGILKTTNSGMNWSQSSTPLEVWRVQMSDAGYGFATAGGSDNCAVYKTTDYGATWNTVFSYASGALYGFEWSNNYMYAAGMQGKIFRANSDGTGWTMQNSGVTAELNAISCCNSNDAIAIAAGDGGTLLMTTNGGVWVKNISSEIPDKYNLYQNYPNPFNPTTNIKYQITNNSFVDLRVFDITGKEISILVNEKQNAGTYEVQFDAGNLSSGIYFYRLKAGNFSTTKKLMVIK